MDKFDIASKTWDQNERRNKMNEFIVKYLKEKVNLENKIILDYGCGTGNLGINLIEKSDKVIFVDKSQGMLDVLSEKLINIDKNRYELIKINEISEFESIENFDILVSSLVFHHIKNINLAVENIYKRLNNSGKIIIIDLITEDGTFHKENFDGHKGFSKDYMKNILVKFGFINVKVDDIYIMEKSIGNLIKKFPIFIAIGEKYE